MRRILRLLVLPVVLALCSTSRADDPIPRKGLDISEDVTVDFRLPKHAEPHRLLRNIEVAEGVALRIEAGTQIACAPGVSLTLKGNLIVEPATNAAIEDEKPRRGRKNADDESFVSFFAGGRAPWGGLRLENEYSGELKRLDLRGADIAVSTSDYCQWKGMKNCRVVGNKTGVLIHSRKGRAALRNCLISGNREVGVLVKLAAYELDHCVISNNGGYGILMDYYGDGKISFCSIVKNGVGVASKIYKTEFTANASNIFGNRGGNLLVRTEDDWRCRQCYWGSTNPSFISATIADGYDQAGKGRVDFTEFASEPVADSGFPVD